MSATPMMQQYQSIRRTLPEGTLLLFRLGDFYELFFEDAKIAAPILNVALTKRNGMPMCGVPFHAAEGYVARLIKAGRKSRDLRPNQRTAAGKDRGKADQSDHQPGDGQRLPTVGLPPKQLPGGGRTDGPRPQAKQSPDGRPEAAVRIGAPGYQHRRISGDRGEFVSTRSKMNWLDSVRRKFWFRIRTRISFAKFHALLRMTATPSNWIKLLTSFVSSSAFSRWTVSAVATCR